VDIEFLNLSNPYKIFIFTFLGLYCQNKVTTTQPGSITVSLCPTNVASICENKGVCTITNGKDIRCICQEGFSGNKINDDQYILNYSILRGLLWYITIINSSMPSWFYGYEM
jgi:hypothetical protein